jgi:hypothetical protein
MRDSGLELGNLGFKLFVNQQKCLQRASDIAVAPRHDFVDGGLV